MSTTLLISIISTAVVYAATVLYAAVGEIFSQRAGIMNLGLEGIMLMGAVSGYMVAVYRQNLVLAMLVVNMFEPFLLFYFSAQGCVFFLFCGWIVALDRGGIPEKAGR